MRGRSASRSVRAAPTPRRRTRRAGGRSSWRRDTPARGTVFRAGQPKTTNTSARLPRKKTKTRERTKNKKQKRGAQRSSPVPNTLQWFRSTASRVCRGFDTSPFLKICSAARSCQGGTVGHGGGSATGFTLHLTLSVDRTPRRSTGRRRTWHGSRRCAVWSLLRGMFEVTLQQLLNTPPVRRAGRPGGQRSAKD